MSGPLSGVKVIELAGIGPGPFAGMMLADMGAEVLRVDRAQSVTDGAPDDDIDRATAANVLGRGRRSVGIDLKHPDGRATVLRLVERADALIEGFRPGVTERLGVGPDECLDRNPRLVYGRMTGWGQDGPYAAMAGHDINYIALSGALSLIGPAGRPPVPPVNMLGDFGGGGMLLAFGVVSALFEAGRSGRGQVIDAAMVDGAALLSTAMWGFKAGGRWGARGSNILDGGAWYYDVYETADGEYITFGAIEPQFFADLVRRTGVTDAGGGIPTQNDAASWPGTRQRMADIVRTRTRAQWSQLLDGTDVCFAPVLSLDDAAEHPHMRARGVLTEVAGVVQPAPAPRFERTPGAIAGPPARPGQHTDAALGDWGFAREEIAALRDRGAVR